MYWYYRFIQSKLSDLVDNLSKIKKKECSECKGKCKFIGFKNDRLRYRCKKCKKTCTKSKDGLIKKVSAHIQVLRWRS